MDVPELIERYGPAPLASPAVTVLIISYNHESFVEAAIASVFAQRTSFAFDVVIGEDCSTDGTLERIRTACASAPIPVTLVTSKQNVGMHANFRRVASLARAKLVALLEGDDYWSCDVKLQRQCDFLRANPEHIAVAHQAHRVFEADVSTEQRKLWPDGVIPVSQLGEISASRIANFDFMIPTASIVVLREIVESMPAWVDDLPMIDWYISLFAALTGPVTVMPDVMSTYRVTSTGAVARMSYAKAKQGHVDLVRKLAASASGHHRRLLAEAHQVHSTQLANWFEAHGHVKNLVQTLRARVAFEIRHRLSIRTSAVWLFRIKFPAAYAFIKSAIITR